MAYTIEMVEENYESSCRLCLNSNSKNINIFENNSYAEIIHTIATSLSIQISQNDDFPKFLCTVCIEKVVSWDSFKKLCIESQEQLSQWREKKFQKHREEEANAISTLSRLETSIHIKEEFIDDSYDDRFEYTYETFTPEFNIKIEPRCDSENIQHAEKSIVSKKTSSPSPSKIPFNYQLVIEMYKDNVCKFCSKKFNRNSNLVQHLRLFHMIVPMHTCFCCGKSFKSKLTAQAHRALCRKRVSVQNSKYSDKSEENDDKLEDPLNTEKQIESTSLEPCDYKFSCSLCGKLFKTIEEWTLHRATHVSNYDIIDGKIMLGSTNSSVNEAVTESIKIQNVRSEDHVTEQQPNISQEEKISSISNLKKSNSCLIKGPLKSKKKFKSRPNFSFKTNGYYLCECGRKFYRIQGFASHKNYHMRRGELFSLKSSNKKNKEQATEKVADKFKCKGCDKMFLLNSKFHFHKKNCISFQQLSAKIENMSEINTEDKSHLLKDQDVINQKAENEKLHTEDSKDPTTMCSFCNRQFVNKGRCLKHENYCLERPKDLKKFMKIYPNAVKCGGCGKCYKSKVNYLKHQCYCPKAILIEAKLKEKPLNNELTSSSLSNLLSCYLCERTFLSRSALTEHQKRCYFQRTSSCIVCKKVFDSFINFRIHYGQNHDRKSLRRLNRLNRIGKQGNINIQTMQTNTWFCKKCKKVFQTRKGYNYHMKSHETIINDKHNCPKCKKYFYHSKHLSHHMQICQEIILENHKLVENLRLKDYNETPSPSSSKITINTAAPCAVCNMSFTTISELREHILMKHKPAFIKERKKKTYFCQFCKMAFDRHSDLNHHFNEYHADNIKTEYPLPPVLKAEGLQEHASIGPICSLCHVSFNTLDELYKHVNTLHNVEM